MRINKPNPGDPLTPQQIYNRINARIDEIETDTYEIEVLLRLLSKAKKFVEDNHTVT